MILIYIIIYIFINPIISYNIVCYWIDFNSINGITNDDKIFLLYTSIVPLIINFLLAIGFNKKIITKKWYLYYLIPIFFYSILLLFLYYKNLNSFTPI